MVSLADNSFPMFLRHMERDCDFPLYPEATSFPSYPNQALQLEHRSAYAYHPTTHDIFPPTSAFEAGPVYHEGPQYAHESPDLQTSTYSTASGHSATSSVVSSPTPGHVFPQHEWNSLGLNTSVVGFDNYDGFGQSTEYHGFDTGMEEFGLEFNPTKQGLVDSSLHAPYHSHSNSSASQSDLPYPSARYPSSPSLSQISSRSPGPVRGGSQSPHLSSHYYPYPPANAYRRSSPSASHDSYSSQDGHYSNEESMEKGRCPIPECGKTFKDLKAHMLTHQSVRPEKCPLSSCSFSTKGFARKYDRNRHTLTHFRGTMVCGFCPGSGSSAEKTFNRADVFKRHLTSVHAVEQTPPNSRKKSSSISNGKTLSGYAPDVTGVCSTCSATFNNAQDLYEHLDDCVIARVQQEEPSEAINAQRLAEVEQDADVHETLLNNALPVTTTTYSGTDDDEEEDDKNDGDFSLRSTRRDRSKNPCNGVQKSRGMTHSKGGVTLSSLRGNGRKKRKDFPSSWGCAPAVMKMKKRVLTVFDGPRRLWKDDMMLDADYEVRVPLGNTGRYVTDLDVQTMRRADAFHAASEEEKGPWISDDLTGVDLERIMGVKREG